MSGFLLILAMGLAAWYAWPAAPTFGIKAATVFFAVFLAPFSWPWLVARGHRARKAAKAAAVRQADLAAQQQRRENERWWQRYYLNAELNGDRDAMRLARDTLAAMGFAVNHRSSGTS